MTESADQGGVPRPEATRGRIIKIAAQRMAVHGYRQTPLEGILARTGISKGTFYHHFSSKEDLGFAVLDHLEEELRAGLAERMAVADDPLDRIEAMLDALAQGQIDRDCRGGCPLGNLAAEVSDQHEGFRTRLSAIFDRWRGMVAEDLGRAIQRSGRRDLDADEMAGHLISSLEGSILMSKVRRDIGDMENSLRHLKRYVRQQFAA